MSSIEESDSWQLRTARKREECANRIPSEWKVSQNFMAKFDAPLSDHKHDLIRSKAIRESGILTDHEIKITEDYTVSDLISALAKGSLSSVEVTLAYCKRAAVAQQLVSCLAETMFVEALERAKHLDDLRAQGKLAGPLHGLPVSIKDNFQFKGRDASIGMVSFINDVCTENSALVDILLKLGAVLYVKTNVPQTMMTADSHNNVFGRTLNPWNTTLGPGGSSGGEGALIALRGSPLGLGTDIGGSVRIPAHCCGIYGFRPSASRVPNGGMRVCTTPGMKFLLSCIGPLSLDLGGIETFFQSLCGARPANYDSSILDVPWRQVDKKPVLRIGVVPESAVFPLHPPIRRVLNEAIVSLKAQGHQIIFLDEKDCRVLEVNEVAWGIFSLDQHSKKLIASAGEPVVPAIGHIVNQFEKLGQIITPSLPDMSALSLMEKLALLNVRRAELREAYRKLWVLHDLDICVAPPAQNTAVQHDMFGLAPYTTFLNCLDYPSCILPFGEVSDQDSGQTFELKADQVAPEYNFDQLKGTPCSIQLFTTTMRDEECLQMAKQIDQCLNRPTQGLAERASNI
ncbi:Amidase [Penicillium verhagenii]|uniref:Amidase n=1 Tax=Penicillium verhagenii TaxID=1562060 RepID=UPI00254573A3|nr:Amidase [Penicillium verhagenii]KAJ5947936.1 Amidase [Penicillium verhagenii]